MLDRFTDTAKRLITGARERAEVRQHSSLTNEHLLEMFIEMPECFAYKLIVENAPYLDFVRRELQSRLNCTSKEKGKPINFDDYCKKSFERAFLLTEKLKHKGISTGSLLLGMLQAEAPQTAPMLRGWGLNLKNMLSMIQNAGDPTNEEAPMAKLSPDITRQMNRMTAVTEDSQRIVTHAQELAKSCNTADINPHHVLLSFVFLASRGIIDVSPLDATTFNLNAVKEIVTQYLTGQTPYAEDRIVFDIALHKVFRIAGLEAYQFGRNGITPNEIALGILQVIPDEASAGLGGDYFALRWNNIDQLGPIVPAKSDTTELEVQDRFPRISLRRYNADQSTVIMIPEKVARDLMVMALDVRDDVLTIAMVNPMDTEIQKKVEELTGMKVAVIKAEEKDLNAAFRINY
ncbi:hypothetical protein JW823_04065 [bacterium]|nr:hypothetical protein [candidate division CSSED10-310 bacterium]